MLGDRSGQGHRATQPAGQAITEEQDLRPLPSLPSLSMATYADLTLPFRETATILGRRWPQGFQGRAMGGLRGESLPLLGLQCPHLSNGGWWMDLEALGR